jgi:hypothetical protein
MSNTVAGTVWNCPNYLGELFTASRLQTPILTMSGGLNGAGQATNFEFPVDQIFSHEAASQPAITETASLSKPTAITYVRSQDKNVCQIHHEAVSLSYSKMSNTGRISGITTSGQSLVPVNELDFQIARALEKISRDVEYSFVQGTYQPATDAGVANTTRGLNAAASSTVAANGAKLSKTLIQSLLVQMYNNGAVFSNSVFVVNAFQKTLLSEIYGYAPTDRNVGGLNIKTIETDFGTFGVTLDPFQSTSVLGIFEMSVVRPITLPVPRKGNMFYEALSKSGAGEEGQIYGQIGLDHGPGFYHGTITGLATS